MDRIAIRLEEPSDQAAVRLVEERAFGRPAEADAVDALREHDKVVLSLVAEIDSAVVGHVLFSYTTVETGASRVIEASLGPIAVLPEHQNAGIGSALVREGLFRCRQLGFGAVFLLGNPAYYGRFGFRPAHKQGVRYHQDLPHPDAFQLVELVDDALAGVTGVAHEEPELG